MKTHRWLIAVMALLVACGNNEEQPNQPQPETGITALGAVDSYFSVSSSTQVRFSKGNLQYQALTDTWRFAEQQYDYVGADNANIAASYGGWVDLFNWGTSGWNNGNDFYHPYNTETVETPGHYGGYGPLNSSSLTGDAANADWGVYCPITNGGNEAGLWRTLTKDEWKYLLSKRANAEAKRGVACVDNHNGLVLLPDDFVLPEGLQFNPGFQADASMEGFGFQNLYSKDEWLRMQKAGAVFLPAAGARSLDKEIEWVGEVGRYWSVDMCDVPGFSTYVWCMYFCSSSLSTADYNNARWTGRSVRLVME